ncbi:hypothetical protein ACFSNO_27535 [Streptomyces cirratus]
MIREELDPDYDGPDAPQPGTRPCPAGTGAALRHRLRLRLPPPGGARGPWNAISAHGNRRPPSSASRCSLDALTPPAAFGDAYHRMVTTAGRAGLHRYVTVPGGAHTDGLVPARPGPPAPDARLFTKALSDLECWTRPTSAS